MRCFTTFLFFFLVAGVYAQQLRISGKIINGKTTEPLSYAHLLLTDYEFGTSTNSDGIFAFEIPERLIGSSILISHIGFQSKVFLLKDLAGGEIELEPLTEGLAEVSITNPVLKKRHTIRPEWLQESIGFGNLNGGLYPSKVARYYDRPDKFDSDCYIEQIELYFYDVREQQNLKAKFRLHVYGVTEDGSPGEELAGNILLEKNIRSENLKVDLIDQKIRIPSDGFFIGVEHLFIKENQFSQIRDYFINDSLVAEDFEQVKYAPVFKGALVDPQDANSWYFSPNGWKKIESLDLSHKTFESGIPVPIFKIKLTD